MSKWKPIETAPKDGSLVDVWCVSPHPNDNVDYGVRLTNVAWHQANDAFDHTGWIRVLDDGSFDPVEEQARSRLGLPAWKPTHWRSIPVPPDASS